MVFKGLLFFLLTWLSVYAECADVAVAQASEKAMSYYWSENVLWMIQQALSLAIPLLFLVSGFTGRLSDFSARWGRQWFFTIAVYVVLYILISQLIFLPFDFYAGYVHQHAYQLSTQSVERWFANEGKAVLVTTISAVSFVWIFYLLLKKSPRRWWFYSSLTSIAVLFITMFVQPIWIDPLFNEFGPMQNKQLEQQILSLAARANIEGARVYEVNKSKDTKKLNAYVTGFGSTNRIVLWDTTLSQMKPEEILFIMGHEMGHYVLHHIWWFFLYFGALSFFIFYLTYRSANWLMDRYRARFGFSRLDNIASLPLLLFITTLFTLLFLPLTNFVSRTMEHQADQFGLEITQNNKVAAESFIVLQQTNLANPRPGKIFKFWQSSHPPLGERIDFANRYCPWKEGKPLRYGKYFKEADS